MRERNDVYSRRNVITGAGLAAGATLVLGQNAWAAQPQKDTSATRTRTDTSEKMEASIAEELMRQHAVANRLLLVYDTAVTPELGTDKPSGPAVTSAAQMLRSTVDDFHVKFEEEHIFPLLQKSGKMGDLINTLREQHAAARTLTDEILKAREEGGGRPASEALARNIRAYVHMLQAHTAYEETLLYPQIRTVASASQYDQLNKALQDMSRTALGAQGFAGLVTKVGELEKSAGITSLAQFTPKAMRQTARETPATQ